MSSIDIADVCRRVAAYTASRPDDRDWWERGSAIRGVLESPHADEHARSEVIRWMDRAIARQTSSGMLANDERDELTTGHLRTATPTPANASSFGFPILQRYEQTRDQRLLDAAVLHAQALLRTPRTAGGAFPLRTEAPEIWVDMAYIMVPFLAKLGRLTGESAYIEESVTQMTAICTYMVDPRRALARHVWCAVPDHFPQSTFWARGNGWLVAGLCDHIELLQGHAAVDALSSTLAKVLDAMRDLQDRSGYLRHVLDDPYSRFESSGTLMFSYAAAKAVRMGIARAELRTAAQCAFDIVAGSVRDDGAVPGVAVPPGGPGVPFATAPFGQGFFLLAERQLSA